VKLVCRIDQPKPPLNGLSFYSQRPLGFWSKSGRRPTVGHQSQFMSTRLGGVGGNLVVLPQRTC
jgi:hypothetical protein